MAPVLYSRVKHHYVGVGIFCDIASPVLVCITIMVNMNKAAS